MSSLPLTRDAADFAARFGAESLIERMPARGADGEGVWLVATVTPDPAGPDATLARAWTLLRAVARWASEGPADPLAPGRHVLVVAWSRSVRPRQGHVLKAGGTLADVRRLAGSPDWQAWERDSGQRAVLPRWQYDVFPAAG